MECVDGLGFKRKTFRQRLEFCTVFKAKTIAVFAKWNAFARLHSQSHERTDSTLEMQPLTFECNFTGDYPRQNRARIILESSFC